MAFDEKKYLDLAGLQSYDEKIKGVINAKETTLDNAIKAVAGDLTAEIANRVAGDKAINDKIGGEFTAENTVAKAIEDAAKVAGEANAALEERVAANEEAIEAINDPATGIAKVAKDAIDAEQARAEAAEKKLTDDLAAEVKRATDAEKALEEAIDAHKELVDERLDILIGEDVNKSARTIANEELAKQLLSGEADADFKTLQQLAAWLEDHPEDAAAMNQAIANLEDFVGELPEDAAATTVIGYVKELVAAEKARAEAAEKAEKERAEAAEKALDERLVDVEALLGEGGGVDERIADAINALDATVASADPEAGKGVKVQVKQLDGKLTEVTVTGNYDNAYDAKGAASAAQTAAEATAAADATSKANQAEANAKNYADSLNGSFVKISTSEINALFD